jgi:alpha-tubulin suppressor-like RCC1 family protein
MSLPKAQLVDPQGNMNLPGMTATGIVTASSLKGVTTGSATGLTGNPDLDVGIVTASSFVGQGVGKAAGLTGTPNLNVGLITATSFVGFVTGDVTGNITGDVTGNITGNIQGDVEGNVTGNVSGLARGLGINGTNVWTGAGTSNLGVGVCTATLLYGDGSGLVGAGASAYIAQEITASDNASDETIIDLSYGNLIYFDQVTKSTTVGFASTSAAEQITFIRDTGTVTPTFTTGGVEFDGNDYLDIPDNADFTLGTGDLTVEAWFKPDASATVSDYHCIVSFGWAFQLYWYQSKFECYCASANSASYFVGTGGAFNSGTASAVRGQYYHIAVTRSGSDFKMFLDGTLVDTASSSTSFVDPSDSASIGRFSPNDNLKAVGIISNLRFIKGTALHTSSFNPPFYELTNVTNTKLLCCQSNSSTTTAAVTPGTITATGDPTASAQTITSSSSVTPSITWPDRVKWNGGTTPTLITNTYSKARQIFRFTTVDTGLNYNAWEEIVYNIDQPNTLFTWGQGSYGQLGQNDRTNRSSPIQVGTNTNWSKIKGFAGSTPFAIKTDGTLWSWGAGGGGQAQNDEISRSSPTQVGTDTTWGPFSVGDPGQSSWGMCQKTDGTLWSWGNSNDYGQMGINIPQPSQRSSPTQIPGTTWSKSSCLNRHGMAIKTDGSLWTWGANYRGQLGNNLPDNNMRSAPIQVGTDTTWSKLAGGYNNSAVIKTDGTLWVWGTAFNGGLGLNQQGNTTNGRSSPAQVGTDTTWDNGMMFFPSVATFIKTDGTLWTWGYNLGYGSLGLNDLADRSSPTQVGTDTTWDTVYSGNGAGAASKTDGTFWIWGNNDNANLGLNKSTDSFNVSSPTQLTGTWSALAARDNGFMGLKPYNN